MCFRAYPTSVAHSQPCFLASLSVWGQPRRLNGIVALAASKKREEKQRAAQCIFCASSVSSEEVSGKRCEAEFELSVSDGMRVDIEEEKRGMFIEVDSDTGIV